MRGCKNEQSHICHDCGRSYNHPSSLNRHLQKAHGVIRRMTKEGFQSYCFDLWLDQRPFGLWLAKRDFQLENPSKQRNPKSTQPQPGNPLDNGARRNDQSETVSPSKQPRKQKAPKSTNQIIAERLATNQIAENIVYELGEPSMLNSYSDPDLIWKQGLLNRAYYNL